MGVKFDFRDLKKPFEADWPVNVPVPVDGGKVETRQFMARFRDLTPEEASAERALSRAADEAVKAGRTPEWPDPKERLRKVFIGLGAGEAEAFTPELVEDLLNEDRTYIALLRAWGSFKAGAPEKNSATPPG